MIISAFRGSSNGRGVMFVSHGINNAAILRIYITIVLNSPEGRQRLIEGREAPEVEGAPYIPEADPVLWNLVFIRYFGRKPKGPDDWGWNRLFNIRVVTLFSDVMKEIAAETAPNAD